VVGRALLLLVWLAGCSTGDPGLVTGERLLVPDCEERGTERVFEPYVFEPDTFIIHLWDNEAYVRLQDEGVVAHRTDVFVLELLDVDALQRAVDAAPFAGVPIDGVLMRAGLAPYRTCPASRVALTARGGIARFRELDMGDGGTIDVVLDGFQLVDMRTGTVLGEGFHAEARVDVGQARLQVPYPNPEVQPDPIEFQW
jgi:hypothetical protein